MITISSYPLAEFTTINKTHGIYCIKGLLSKSFLAHKQNTLFIAPKQINLSSFTNNINKKHNGFLLEILFHGFNFSSRRFSIYRPKFSIDTHKSEIFICDEPVTSVVKSRVHKRRLIFFSYDSHLLHIIEKAIKEFKLPDAYTGKGLFERNDSYNVKQRKKRK